MKLENALVAFSWVGPLLVRFTEFKFLSGEGSLCSCTIYTHILLNLTAENVAARRRMAVGVLLLNMHDHMKHSSDLKPAGIAWK